MSQTQLQELESTILQRRQYLQGQDNQIQRNLQLLQKQQRQVKLNEAKLSKQQSNLDSLTKDAQAALESLRKQAEAAPSKRYIELSEKCAALVRECAKLKNKKQLLNDTIANGSDQLSRLDAEIIEADAIYKDIQEQIKQARRRLRTQEQRAEFQAGVVSNLQYDIDKQFKQLEGMTATKISLEKDRDSLTKQLAAKNDELQALQDSIHDKSEELATLNKNISEVNKSLSLLTKKDKEFRRGLAEEKLKLERERENVKVEKQSVRREIEVRRHIDPKWKLKTSDEPQHFKL